jgi:hypothetical protein
MKHAPLWVKLLGKVLYVLRGGWDLFFPAQTGQSHRTYTPWGKGRS